jgi:lipocalin-like protein
MNSEAENLVGTWKLKSFEVRTSTSEVSYPFGRDARGCLIMTSNGYWSVSVMSPNRVQFASNDVLGGTTREKVSAAEGYVSYAGPYHVRGDKVVVGPEVSFFPNWVGKDQERLFKITGNILELSTLPMLVQGRQQTAHLVWERAQ